MRENFYIVLKGDIIKEIRLSYKLKTGK